MWDFRPGGNCCLNLFGSVRTSDSIFSAHLDDEIIPFPAVYLGPVERENNLGSEGKPGGGQIGKINTNLTVSCVAVVNCGPGVRAPMDSGWRYRFHAEQPAGRNGTAFL